MTIENVENWLKQNNLPYWRVCYFGGREVAFKSQEIDVDDLTGKSSTSALNVDDSITHFRGLMQMYPAGRYMIYGRKTVNGRNSEQSLPFNKLEANGTQAVTTSMAGIGSIGNIYESNFNTILGLHTQMADLRAKQIETESNYKLELFKLQQKREPNNQFDKIIDFVGGIMQQNLAGNAPKPTEIGNANSSGNTPNVEEKRLEKALTDIQKASGEDFVKGMEGLAKFAKNNPENFKLIMQQFL